MKNEDVGAIQRVVARTIATLPVGRNLLLVGGFRYRLLDGSVRVSDDIDYHWAGDLAEKQSDLLASLRRVLLPEVSRRFGYSGSADARSGSDADSPSVRTVDLSFWKDGEPYSRIEIPVEVTRIACADPVEVRTAAGTIYATASDGDMIESKVIAILGSTFLRHRDLVDLFLFQDHLTPDSSRRLPAKLRSSGIAFSAIEKRMSRLRKHSDYHAKAVQEVIDTQLDAVAAAQLNDAGGGRVVLDAATALLKRYVRSEMPDESD